MRERDAWRAGLLSLALALAVRLGPAAVRGLEHRNFPEKADAFLLYLQTGLRQASTAPLPLYYAPESSGPETVQEAAPVLLSRRETPEKPVFTAEDGAAVLLDNDAGVSPDVEDLIQLAPDFPAADGPKVLIYSTHTTESYTKSGENYIETAAYRTLDSGFNMLSLGRALEEALARRGIGVIRDEGLHDYPSYNSAYVSSRKSAEAYLEEFPSLALVLDLHRDATAGTRQLRPLAQTASGTSAKIMLVVGTDAGGRSHPNWDKNLSLALRLQTLLERASPGITRPLNLRTQRFNQDLSPGALLVEIGGAGNTHEEALAAVEILAEGIRALLS